MWFIAAIAVVWLVNDVKTAIACLSACVPNSQEESTSIFLLHCQIITTFRSILPHTTKASEKGGGARSRTNCSIFEAMPLMEKWSNLFRVLRPWRRKKLDEQGPCICCLKYSFINCLFVDSMAACLKWSFIHCTWAWLTTAWLGLPGGQEVGTAWLLLINSAFSDLYVIIGILTVSGQN